jgi:hypothetical protein
MALSLPEVTEGRGIALREPSSREENEVLKNYTTFASEAEGATEVERLGREHPARLARANERDGDGAGNGGRTRDIHLGKVALYH